MKTEIVTNCLVASFLLAFNVFGQASFAFQNRDIVYGIDAPVFDAQGVPLAGTNYLAELWGGTTPDSLTPALELSRNSIRLMVPFSNNGYFFSSAGFLTVPANWPGGGGYAWLQVRAWDARLGPTYEAVAALGIGGYGESPLFYARGSDPFLALPEPPAPLIGLQSFSLRPIVPEPSSWALLAVAATASCWLVRRYRRGCPSTRPSAARH